MPVHQNVTVLDAKLQQAFQMIQSVNNKIKVSNDKADEFLFGINLNQLILQQQLDNIKESISLTQTPSSDGTLTWKIDEVSGKIVNAQLEHQLSIYSPPFYSSLSGYKMRARLFLLGDENARRTHMSLFFVLMRGEYDAIQKWPFDHNITFCLYDLSGQHQHIINSFRPDTKSDSFQCPRLEMNTASGFSKFVPLEMIQRDDSRFVKNDTMFIKVSVDFCAMHPNLLPHIPQPMNKKEVDRQDLAAAIPIDSYPPPCKRARYVQDTERHVSEPGERIERAIDQSIVYSIRLESSAENAEGDVEESTF
ncbi:unnamed protein product [Didymodactylos carnosus]|nr:unnamed protein product [Didymodactylos carnosus]CAF3929230.1 unnamed protein product [Didymodactylos carnosus]